MDGSALQNRVGSAAEPNEQAAVSEPSLAVIGCGNPNRRDDGAGPSVTDGMGVMYAAKGASHLILVDARAPEGQPGAIYDVPGDFLEAQPPQSFNLHDFRWDHALFAGKKIYGDAFPKQVKVFLIEAADLDLGLGLSDPVAQAVTKVADQIAALAGSFASGASAGDWS